MAARCAQAPHRAADVWTPTDRPTERAAELSGPLIRTQVELAFRKDATVAAVNDLPRRVEGRLVASPQGVAIVVVRIPDPGSAAALDQLLAQLAADPLVRAANPVLMPRPTVLPDTINIDAGETSLVRHHLAVRAHAAWNARAALTGATRPTLVLGDLFGGGPPDAMLYGPVADASDFATTTGAGASEHGYHVLGIAAGAFDTTGATSLGDAVTGMFPGSLALRAADVELGRGSDWPEDQSHDLEGRFLHATGAGNVETLGPLGADLSSDWNAATLIAPLIDPATLELVPNLTNTLVVENFMASSGEPYEPDCISPSSEQGGTIAAIGTEVFSFTAATTTGSRTGTSMATPQVAGLAAYV